MRRETITLAAAGTLGGFAAAGIITAAGVAVDSWRRAQRVEAARRLVEARKQREAESGAMRVLTPEQLRGSIARNLMRMNEREA